MKRSGLSVIVPLSLALFYACATPDSDDSESFDSGTDAKAKLDAKADQSTTDSAATKSDAAEDTAVASDTSVKDTSTKDTSATDASVTDTSVMDSSVSDTFVNADSSNPPGLGVVINEVDYDQMNIDNAEFVEIYNPTSTTQDLSKLALVFINGANNASVEYLRFPLSGTLDAGKYWVVAVPSLTVDPGATVARFALASNNIQNGDPDGIFLLDTQSSTIVDALSYGGTLNQCTEGQATTEKDSNTVTGSLIRNPNGKDTNNNLADWKFTTTPTPGKDNVLTP